MSYRHLTDLKKRFFDPTTRAIRALLSWRRLDLEDSNGDRCVALGREDENGNVEADEMDVLSPVGLIARPEENSTVEAVVGYIGADGDHPVAVNVLDHGRRAVIDAVGLDADETIVHTSQALVKILADGTVEVRSLDGTAKALAYKSDADALNARIDALESYINSLVLVVSNAVPAASGPVLAGPPSGPPGSPPSATSATIDGTTVIKGE